MSTHARVDYGESGLYLRVREPSFADPTQYDWSEEAGLVCARRKSTSGLILAEPKPAGPRAAILTGVRAGWQGALSDQARWILAIETVMASLIGTTFRSTARTPTASPFEFQYPDNLRDDDFADYPAFPDNFVDTGRYIWDDAFGMLLCRRRSDGRLIYADRTIGTVRANLLSGFRSGYMEGYEGQRSWVARLEACLDFLGIGPDIELQAQQSVARDHFENLPEKARQDTLSALNQIARCAYLGRPVNIALTDDAFTDIAPVG